MSLINKITRKFQNLLRFEKLNPIDDFDFEDNFEKNNSKNNIVLF